MAELALLSLPSSMLKYFTEGIIKNNPVLVLLIGLCPTLAVSTTAFNALGMGAAVIFVLVLSNFTIALIKPFTPNEIRIPIFIIVISTFVTIIDYVMHAYLPDLYGALGIFVPLIAVNCIILGRAEAFAYKHSVIQSILDGFGSGIGFTLAIFAMGAIREILGSGKIFGHVIMGSTFTANPVIYMVLPPGGFLVIAFLMGISRLRKGSLSADTGR